MLVYHRIFFDIATVSKIFQVSDDQPRPLRFVGAQNFRYTGIVKLLVHTHLSRTAGFRMFHEGGG